jgi:hypothetical protein
MTTSEVLRQYLGPTGSIVVLFTATYGLFSLIEGISSSDARHYVSDHVKGLAPSSHRNAGLPVKAIFERVFTKRHISWKCARNSVALSIAWLLVFYTMMSIYHPNTLACLFRDLINEGGDVKAKRLDKLPHQHVPILLKMHDLCSSFASHADVEPLNVVYRL